MKKLFLIVLMAFSMIANAQGLHWTYNSHTQYNMTITGEMYLNGESLKTNPDAQYLEIGIFAGDECRGAYLPTINPASYYQGYAYLMQVYANTNGEEMNFKVYNHITEEVMDVVCTSGFTFQSDANLGTLRNPYAIEFFSPCEITVAANPTAGGTVDGGGVYNHGTTATLSAVANTGYTFVNWTKGTEVVSTTAEFSVIVTEAADYVANFNLNSYNITASVAPANSGTVTGAGTYNHFASCTLTATAATGYTFTNWTKDGQVVSTNATYTFEVTGAGAYVANFTLNTYAITATANPTAGGTVAGAGTYNHGASCTLTATANTGYHFVNWTKGGTAVSTNPAYTFTVTEAGAYVANFEINSYAITATANPTAGGTVAGAGTYNHGASCTLTATPATGYHFVNWTKGGTAVSTNAAYTFTVTEAGAYVANFAINTYEITATANPTAGGTVIGAGTFNHGASCTLTATANTGYHFVNWTKGGTAVSTNATYTFTVTEAGAYVANFELNTYAVTATANPTAGGTVAGAGTYTHGTTATMTATAATGAGYHFVNWTKGTDVVSTNATYSFTVTEATELVANFALNNYTITVSANPTAGGTASGAGTYTYGQTATLTATAATGYTFTNWKKDGQVVSTSATYELTVTDGGAYVANFALNTYTITATASPAAGGTITGAGTYAHGESATLTATAATGYTFTNWTKNGTVVSTNAEYTFTVTGAAAYVANFTLNTYAITATANPTAGGTVAGAGTYNHGASCTLTATAATGYTFVNWTKNGTAVSTNASYTFTVTEAGAYVANFSLNSYEITASAEPSYAGTTTGAGTYSHGTSVTLSAIANTGYSFISWTKNGQVVSTTANYTFTVTEGGAYVANFNPNQYTVVTVASPSVGGTVSGDGQFLYGQTCTVNAEPAEGYTFVNWTNNAGDIVSTNVTYQFNVYNHEMMTAHFSWNAYSITAAANPSYGGTVEGAGSYNYGTSCTLTATAATGYTFVNWTLAGVEVSTDAAYTFTVTEAGNYIANFEINTYEITAVANPAVGGSVSGAGTYNYHENCTLSATEANGYEFINWTKGNQVVSTEPSFTFQVTEDGDYVANFEEIIVVTYEVTVAADPADLGTVTGGGTYEEGETVTITATPAIECTFINWTENGTVVSEDPEFTFVIAGNRNFVAHFDFDSVIEISDSKLNVYPNPVVTELVITNESAITSCEIYTITGEMVYNLSCNTTNVVVNVENLTAGSYIVRIAAEGTVQTRRFIKE